MNLDLFQAHIFSSSFHPQKMGDQKDVENYSRRFKLKSNVEEFFPEKSEP